jgi:hypothetical protein
LNAYFFFLAVFFFTVFFAFLAFLAMLPSMNPKDGSITQAGNQRAQG